jgi:internalin A
MRKFTWLQITDIHCGQLGRLALWPNVRTHFLDDVRWLHAQVGRFDAVLITGDIANTAAATDYVEFDEQVLGPLRDLISELQTRTPAFLAVPGNHDVSRPTSKSAAVRQLTRRNGLNEIEEDFWANPQSEYHSLLAGCFGQFIKWRDSLPQCDNCEVRTGAIPGDFSATLRLSEDQETSPLTIGIAGINSAFLQLDAGDYKERLHVDVRQLHEACGKDVPNWVSRHNACLLMSHHGPEWLDATCRSFNYPELYPAGRFAVHLFGHMHETAMRSTMLGGGIPSRIWQGRSLFGLEKCGSQGSLRSHGYSAGQISFGDITNIRHWPRRAFFDANGWRFDADVESCKLEKDFGTLAEQVRHGGQALEQGPEATGRFGKHQVRSATARWNAPAHDSALQRYAQAICSAHSHIRFVEIPYLKDFSDVQIDKLYVEPRFSGTQIHPDSPPSSWNECITTSEALHSNRHLVLLGDPGSGKSTLISCLSWQLCRPDQSSESPWIGQLRGLCPVPIILRELKLTTDISWERLIDEFLRHRIGKVLPDKTYLEKMLRDGRAVVMLDGLDEIGNLTVRRKLRDAVHAGMALYPHSRWLLTSRLVGYESVPFHVRTERVSARTDIDGEVVSASKKSKIVRSKVADVLYLAPFNDDQISEFSRNWHVQHEPDKSLVPQNTSAFVSAVKENEGTQRLARIPYLLTLMALIHHKSATLPHGRTELYDRIAAAYLESIDLKRQLDQLPYSLSQKKRWLAFIAYQMQLRRGAAKGRSQKPTQILATRADIRKWLHVAMKESSTSVGDSEVNALIEYFAARSGLLLPRGEGMFAFMHLSLQEYFAACFLEPRLTASRFAPNSHSVQPSDGQLRTWANDQSWREAYVLLFELLSQKSVSETEGFLNHIFEGAIDDDANGTLAVAYGLLAEICTDPFVTLGAETRRRYLQKVWRWLLARPYKRESDFGRSTYGVLRALVRDSKGNIQDAWRSASVSKVDLKRAEILDLGGCRTLEDLSHLEQLPNLRQLDLSGCSLVKRGWNVLRRLKKLERLDLTGCSPAPEDLLHISGHPSLRALTVTTPIDLGLLSKNLALEELHLHFEPTSADLPFELGALAHLRGLNHICALQGETYSVAPQQDGSATPILSPGVAMLLQLSRSSGSRPERVRNSQARNRMTRQRKANV